MSLVGPRPHALSHDDFFSSRIVHYGRRFCVRPGLTGLAQVSGLRGEIQSLDCMAKRVSADLVYIDHWSLGLDVQLLWRTLWLIGRDRRAY
jgi:putative colanic acid biosysnthesis UDP-glucose lipid carrier transferase